MRFTEEKEAEMLTKMLGAFNQIFDEDSEFHIEKEDLEEYSTEFIYLASNSMPNFIYSELTGKNPTNLQFNHIANHLCFQFSTKESDN